MGEIDPLNRILSDATNVDRPVFGDSLNKITLAPPTEFPRKRPLITGTESFAPAWLAEWHRRGDPDGVSGELSCYFASNVVLFGAGQLAQNGYLLTHESFLPDYQRRLLGLTPGVSLRLDEACELPLRVVSGPCVPLCGHGVRVYGHFLLESLLKLLVSRRAIEPSGMKVKYVLDYRTPPWAINLLGKVFGIGGGDIVLFNSAGERLLLEEAVLPSLACVRDRFHPFTNELIKDLLNQIDVGHRKSDIERIFISRQLFFNPASVQRRCLNEDSLLRIAVSKFNFTPLPIETIPWRSQVAIFAGASIVVGEYGSALHNGLFASQDTRIGAIGCLNRIQSNIGELRGHLNAFLNVRIEGDYSVDEDEYCAFLDAITKR